MEKLITKIEAQKNNKNRVNVFIDNEFMFSCSTELIYYHKLKIGKKLDIDNFNEILEEDNYIKAKEIALKYIERYFRSEKQVERKLVEKEFNIKTIEKAIMFLKEYKFIDDDKLCEMYVNDNKNKFGKLKLKNNLMNKGINEELIQKYLTKVDSYEYDVTAKKLAEKKYEKLIKSESSKKAVNKKLGEYLLRQGFDFETVKSITSKFYCPEEEVESNNFQDLSKLNDLMNKKYNSLLKKEKDSFIVKKKLFDYLLRKGYKYEDIKSSFTVLITETIQEGYHDEQ